MKLGIVPAVISPFALAKIGPGAARRCFVTGERFGAETALRIGLVHEVADDLDAAVDASRRGAPRRRPRGGAGGEGARPRPAPAEETARRSPQHRTSDEGQEGLRAFLEKRARAPGVVRTLSSDTP